MPIRMTVIRLSDGNLTLYSPTPYNRALHNQVTELGTIRYLVAPNVAHWMYVKGWQDAVPQARTFAVKGLSSRSQVQNSGLRIDHEVEEKGRQFGQEIEVVLISAPHFQEVVLFHHPTRTLILADLVQNFEPERLPFGIRMIGAAIGVTSPDGRAPLYLRLLILLNKTEAVQAAQRLVDFGPERVIFAHGKWFDSQATYQLRRSFRWLLPPAQKEEPQRVIFPWVAAGIAVGGLAIGFLFWSKRRRRNQIDQIAKDLLEFVRSKKWGP